MLFVIINKFGYTCSFGRKTNLYQNKHHTDTSSKNSNQNEISAHINRMKLADTINSFVIIFN